MVHPGAMGCISLSYAGVSFIPKTADDVRRLPRRALPTLEKIEFLWAIEECANSDGFSGGIGIDPPVLTPRATR